MADWNPIDSPCDYIVLSDRKSPGIAEVIGASNLRKWDELEGLGISGSGLRFRGRRLAHFTVKIRLYSPQDWADWHAWKPIVMALPKYRGGNGNDTGALSIQHPQLEEVEIGAVAVEEVLQPEQTDHGEWTIEIKFVEFRRPRLTLAKLEGAAATPSDPAEDLIGKLTDQLQLDALASEP